MIVKSFKDIKNLRNAENLNHVNIDMTQFVAGGIPNYVGKLGIWSLAKNGTLTINCSGAHSSPNVLRGKISFNLLCQTLFPAILPYASIEKIDRSKNVITFRRTSPKQKSNNWSFGIIFSGDLTELSLLSNCISSIQNQSIFDNEWEIVVCGPADAEMMVISQFDVNYLSYENNSNHKRFNISSKKNYLIKSLKHDKVLICHTRICLEAECISNLPHEFEVITPSVSITGNMGIIPYLDLGFIRGFTRNLNFVKTVPCHYNRNNWVSYLSKAIPYIDGGLYCINSLWVKDINLSEHLAWAEAEDVEWCQRLNANGLMCELSLTALAYSQTCKIERYKKYGHSMIYRLISRIINL